MRDHGGLRTPNARITRRGGAGGGPVQEGTHRGACGRQVTRRRGREPLQPRFVRLLIQFRSPAGSAGCEVTTSAARGGADGVCSWGAPHPGWPGRCNAFRRGGSTKSKMVLSFDYQGRATRLDEGDWDVGAQEACVGRRRRTALAGWRQVGMRLASGRPGHLVTRRICEYTSHVVRPHL
jgi:hypothetical protein